MSKSRHGVYQMTNDEYHSAEGLSRSALWLYRENPYKYWYQYLSCNYVRPKETEALRLGSLIHTAILEPHLLDELYIPKPEYEKLPEALLLKDVGREEFERIKEQRTLIKNANDELKRFFEYVSEGKTVVSADDLQMAANCRNAVYRCEKNTKLLAKAQVEQSIFWTDEETGILCKARPDAFSRAAAIDLKTSRSANGRYFQSAATKEGYFLQAGMIFEGMKAIGHPIKKFVFIAIEKEPPYAVGTYILDDEAVQYGIDLFHALLRKYAVSRETNSFDDYGFQILMAPKYALEELNHD